jgi:hypothetical protein
MGTLWAWQQMSTGSQPSQTPPEVLSWQVQLPMSSVSLADRRAQVKADGRLLCWPPKQL